MLYYTLYSPPTDQCKSPLIKTNNRSFSLALKQITI